MNYAQEYNRIVDRLYNVHEQPQSAYAPTLIQNSLHKWSNTTRSTVNPC